MATVTTRPAGRLITLPGGELPGRSRRQLVARVLLILMSIVMLTPLYWMIVTALKSNQELTAYPPTLWPHAMDWANFTAAVTAIPFWTFLKNTLIVTALSVLGSVISNPFIAYGFSRINWPGRDKVFYLVLATVFIPFPVLIVALFDIFAKLHWVNTFLPLVVPMFLGQAFWIFLMRQFLMQLPGEISEAARIDGASELDVFFRVVMPLAMPAIGVIGVLSAITAWNDFLGPLIYLQSESMYTLAIGLTFFRAAHDVQFNLLMAASTLVVVPVVIIFLMFQKTLVEGITMGSVK